jgi:thiol-disulfide isomerase/thioredoxin
LAQAPIDAFTQFDKFEQDIMKPSANKKIKVINFWATWCKPCVQELPYFLTFANMNPDVELILVSLDVLKDKETKLQKFVNEKSITQRVVLLAAPDQNSWIDKVDPQWGASIPLTVVIKPDGTKKIFEQEFDSVDSIITILN